MLAQWAPGSPGQDSAGGLGAIRSVWTEIVGADVARHATPFERNADTLTVRVSSSVWAHQLGLSSAHILRALRAAGIEDVERLRFRTGRARAIGRVLLTPRVDPQPSRVEDEPAEPSPSLQDAFERFRRRLSNARDAKLTLGWKQCEQCNAMVPEADKGRCAVCATAEASERSLRLQRLMYEAPWLGWHGTAELAPGLTHEEYETNRKALLARWWDTLERGRRTGSLRPGGNEARTASSYLLLKTGWAPERITPAIARNELGDDIYNALWGTKSTNLD